MTAIRTTVEDLLNRIGEGDPARIAELYAEQVDWKLSWPKAEHARATGRAYRARFALHLTVENGLVTRTHIYEDSLAVAQAFDAR
ncbi:MAG: nuclear transport factor 2 family protein [Stackebrandtia sp.]